MITRVFHNATVGQNQDTNELNVKFCFYHSP